MIDFTKKEIQLDPYGSEYEPQINLQRTADKADVYSKLQADAYSKLQKPPEQGIPTPVQPEPSTAQPIIIESASAEWQNGYLTIKYSGKVYIADSYSIRYYLNGKYIGGSSAYYPAGAPLSGTRSYPEYLLRDTYRITFTGSDYVEIKVFNSNGKQVYSKKFLVGTPDKTLTQPKNEVPETVSISVPDWSPGQRLAVKYTARVNAGYWYRVVLKDSKGNVLKTQSIGKWSSGPVYTSGTIYVDAFRVPSDLKIFAALQRSNSSSGPWQDVASTEASFKVNDTKDPNRNVTLEADLANLPCPGRPPVIRYSFRADQKHTYTLYVYANGALIARQTYSYTDSYTGSLTLKELPPGDYEVQLKLYDTTVKPSVLVAVKTLSMKVNSICLAPDSAKKGRLDFITKPVGAISPNTYVTIKARLVRGADVEYKAIIYGPKGRKYERVFGINDDPQWELKIYVPAGAYFWDYTVELYYKHANEWMMCEGYPYRFRISVKDTTPIPQVSGKITSVSMPTEVFDDEQIPVEVSWSADSYPVLVSAAVDGVETTFEHGKTQVGTLKLRIPPQKPGQHSITLTLKVSTGYNYFLKVDEKTYTITVKQRAPAAPADTTSTAPPSEGSTTSPKTTSPPSDTNTTTPSYTTPTAGNTTQPATTPSDTTTPAAGDNTQPVTTPSDTTTTPAAGDNTQPVTTPQDTQVLDSKAVAILAAGLLLLLLGRR